MNKKLQNIAELSHKYGKNPDFVFLGGGNTSVKNAEELYIKPSGIRLATIEPEQFLKMDRAVLRRCFHIDESLHPDEREALVKDATMAAVRPIGAGRPSVEAPVHEIIDYTYVVHLHPALVNGMTCARFGKKACSELFPDALWLDYCDPGYTLANTVKKALDKAKAARGCQPHVFFLQNHGVFVAADTPREINVIYADMIGRLKAVYDIKDLLVPPKFEAVKGDVKTLPPRLRAILAGDDGKRPVVHCLGRGKAYAGPLTPDHIVYAKSFAYKGQVTTGKIGAFARRNKYLPKIVEVPDEGLFVAGDTYKNALETATALKNGIFVEHLTKAFGGPHYMTKRQYGFIENWEVESYRRKVNSAGAASRLDNRVCIVMDSGEGLGHGVADALAASGGIVVAVDADAKKAKATAAALCEKYGAGKALAVAGNVDDDGGMSRLAKKVAVEVGGVDLLVANYAGKGNATDGYFRCVKHIGALMADQNLPRRDCRFSDVVIVAGYGVTAIDAVLDEPVRLIAEELAAVHRIRINFVAVGNCGPDQVAKAVMHCVESENMMGEIVSAVKC